MKQKGKGVEGEWNVKVQREKERFSGEILNMMYSQASRQGCLFQIAISVEKTVPPTVIFTQPHG